VIPLADGPTRPNRRPMGFASPKLSAHRVRRSRSRRPPLLASPGMPVARALEPV
jgi:hypothetical protein